MPCANEKAFRHPSVVFARPADLLEISRFLLNARSSPIHKAN